MASAFDFSTLQSYVDASQIELIGKPLLKNKSAKYFQTVTGVKNIKQLPLLDVSPWYGDGGSCSPTYSGSVSISTQNITVGQINSAFEFCIPKLNNYFTNQMLAKGAHQETYSAEQDVVAQASAAIAKDLETAIWQASTVASASATPALLGKFDGAIRMIENNSGSYINATGSVAGGNLITGSITTANVRQLIEKNVYQAIPLAILYEPETAVFLGVDTFQTYLNAVNTGSGNFQVYMKDTPDEAYIYGTTMRLVPVAGLQGTSKIVAFNLKNAWKGVDLESDSSDGVRSFFDNKTNTANLIWEFHYGTAFSFYSQVVYAFIH